MRFLCRLVLGCLHLAAGSVVGADLYQAGDKFAFTPPTAPTYMPSGAAWTLEVRHNGAGFANYNGSSPYSIYNNAEVLSARIAVTYLGETRYSGSVTATVGGGIVQVPLFIWSGGTNVATCRRAYISVGNHSGVNQTYWIENEESGSILAAVPVENGGRQYFAVTIPADMQGAGLACIRTASGAFSLIIGRCSPRWVDCASALPTLSCNFTDLSSYSTNQLTTNVHDATATGGGINWDLGDGTGGTTGGDPNSPTIQTNPATAGTNSATEGTLRKGFETLHGDLLTLSNLLANFEASGGTDTNVLNQLVTMHSTMTNHLGWAVLTWRELTNQGSVLTNQLGNLEGLNRTLGTNFGTNVLMALSNLGPWGTYAVGTNILATNGGRWTAGSNAVVAADVVAGSSNYVAGIRDGALTTFGDPGTGTGDPGSGANALGLTLAVPSIFASVAASPPSWLPGAVTFPSADSVRISLDPCNWGALIGNVLSWWRLVAAAVLVFATFRHVHERVNERLEALWMMPQAHASGEAVLGTNANIVAAAANAAIICAAVVVVPSVLLAVFFDAGWLVGSPVGVLSSAASAAGISGEWAGALHFLSDVFPVATAAAVMLTRFVFGFAETLVVNAAAAVIKFAVIGLTVAALTLNASAGYVTNELVMGHVFDSEGKIYFAVTNGNTYTWSFGGSYNIVIGGFTETATSSGTHVLTESGGTSFMDTENPGYEGLESGDSVQEIWFVADDEIGLALADMTVWAFTFGLMWGFTIGFVGRMVTEFRKVDV